MNNGKPKQALGMSKSLCGRADLLLVPADLLPDMARLLGFEEITAKPATDKNTVAPSQGKTPSPKTEASTEAQETSLVIPFWRVTACQYHHPINQPEKAKAKGDISTPPQHYPEELAAPPTTKPLSTWPVLLPYLRRVAMRAAPSAQPDLKATVRRLSRGELLPKLPRKSRRAWGMQAQVILDRSRRLIPYWQDQLDVLQQIQHLFPVDSVSTALYWDGMDAPVFDNEALSPYRLPAPDTLVLVLGDLGFFSTDKRPQKIWRDLGERLQERGCRPLALLPTGKHRPNPPWQHFAWECRRSPAQTAFAKAFIDAAPVEQLLTLLSPAIRIEPGLLRAVRQLLGLDAAVETAFWQHPALTGISSVAATLNPDHAKPLRARFDGLDQQCRTSLLAHLCQWRDGLPAEIWIEECYASSPRTRELLAQHPKLKKYICRAEEFYAYLGETLSTAPADADARAWVRRMEPRIANRAEQPDSLQRDLDRLHHIAHADERQSSVPAGYDPVHIPSDAPLRTWQIYQQHESLLLLEAAHSGAVEGQGGSWLGQLQSRNGQVSLSEGLPFWLGQAPAWADAWGQDAYGLWVEFCFAEVRQRLRWIPAGHFLMGSPASEEGRRDDETQHQVNLSEGFWLFDTAVTQALWVAVMGENPSRFQSPERPVEQVSWEDAKAFIEKLNSLLPDLELTLPSEAQWEYACRADTQTATYAGDLDILGELNAPLLDKIAWYAGNSGVDFELENGYDSSYWEEKQYQQAGTHPVALKQANAWGLYDMLGNIDEWCEDYWGDYSVEIQTNPTGVADGSSRVVRGGSWFNFARIVRAAYRNHYVPDYRGLKLGFRCLQVQAKASSVLAQQVAEAVAGPRGSWTQQPQQGVAGSLLQLEEAGFYQMAWPQAADFILRSDAGTLHVSAAPKPRWASNIGRDRYGLWAEFVLGEEAQKVRQRLRWIPPGQFMMGSPKSEPDLLGNEIQHEVTLTQGFWLFDTAVPQALWQVVMGKNPSNFQDPHKPVEQVSWNDCKKFINKINQALPDLALSLPTEAQWEYACRAGTQTAFYFGDNITQKQVNYGYKRKKTVVVKSLPANVWGLYEMHGNVYEWCVDYWGDYSAEPQTDPKGATNGNSRVVRGGSWFVSARNVRAACRSHYEPDNRNYKLGFRCLQVQRELKQANKQVKQNTQLPSKEAAATSEEAGGLF